MSFVHLINENFRNSTLVEDVKYSLPHVETKLTECLEHLRQIKIKEKQIKENWVSAVQDKELKSQLSTLKEQFEKALKDLKLEQDDAKSTYNHYKEIKNKILTENKEVVNENTITGTLPPSIDKFLMDMSQMYIDDLTYTDISKFGDRFTEDDIKQLKKYKTELSQGFEEDDPEVQNIFKSIRDIVKGISESIEPLNEAEITLDDEDMFDPKSFSLSGLVNRKVQQEKDAEAAALKAAQNAEAAQKVQRAIKIAKGEDDELDALLEELVPPSGKCDTLAGEIVRAIKRLLYRDSNDGDKFLYGYGLETCAPAAAFLHSHGYDGPIESIMEEIGQYSFDYSGVDDIYTTRLEELADKIVQDIFMGKFQETNDSDLWDSEHKWIIEQQPTEDMYIDYSDKILAHYNKGNVTASDIASWVEDMGNWDSTFKDIEVSGSYSDVHVDNLNYDAFNELSSMVDDGKFWSAYEDELKDEYGDPEEDEDFDEEDEEYDDDFDNEIIEEDLADVQINDDFDLDLDSSDIQEEDSKKDFTPVSRLVEKLGL